MRFKEIASRLTGVSCPVFGVSWNPPEPEITTARRVITFMEDRRVLYTPSEVELPDHCVQSVIEIRHFLTDELGKSKLTQELADGLRAMRASCRKFLNRIQAEDREIIPHASHHGHWASWVFMDALGQLRGEFGIHLAQLAVRNGLDVEDELAQIFPGRDEETKGSNHRLQATRVPKRHPRA